MSDYVRGRRSDDGRLEIKPSDERTSLDDTQDDVSQLLGATNIESQADREDVRPDVRSSKIIKHNGRDQRNNAADTGCRICRKGFRRNETTGL